MTSTSLTPQEAIQKRCYRDQSSSCIADLCMAWREAVEREPLTELERRSAGMSAGIAQALKPEIIPRKGYCGACGKP